MGLAATEEAEATKEPAVTKEPAATTEKPMATVKKETTMQASCHRAFTPPLALPNLLPPDP